MHNLNLRSDGTHAFMSVKEKAWHGLGKIVQDYPTSAEALEFAGLNFNVNKLPNIHRLPNGEELVSDSSFFTYRSDNLQILGDRVGSDYTVLQNRDAFKFFDAIVGGEEGIMYETAGALGKGERIFITAKLPSYIRVGKDDLIENYIFLSSTHDGSGSVIAAFTPVRIVCNNTLNAALRNMSNVIRIRHTSSALDRLEQAHKVLGISNNLTGMMGGIFNQFAKTKISDTELEELINKALRTKANADKDGEELSTRFTNTVDEIMAFTIGHETQQTPEAKGTLYGAYNGITGYYQNHKFFESKDDKLKSIMFGTARDKGQRAFDLCLEFAKK